MHLDTELASHLHAQARMVAARLLGSGADADEVAQESVARAAESWDRIGSYAEPWVVRVATNLSIEGSVR